MSLSQLLCPAIARSLLGPQLLTRAVSLPSPPPPHLSPHLLALPQFISCNCFSPTAPDQPVSLVALRGAPSSQLILLSLYIPSPCPLRSNFTSLSFPASTEVWEARGESRTSTQDPQKRSRPCSLSCRWTQAQEPCPPQKSHPLRHSQPSCSAGAQAHGAPKV